MIEVDWPDLLIFFFIQRMGFTISVFLIKNLSVKMIFIRFSHFGTFWEILRENNWFSITKNYAKIKTHILTAIEHARTFDVWSSFLSVNYRALSNSWWLLVLDRKRSSILTKNAVFVANLVLSLCLCMPIYMNQKWYISNKNDVLYHILRGQAWNLLKRHPNNS